MIYLFTGIVWSILTFYSLNGICRFYLAGFISYYSIGILASILVGVNEQLLTLYGLCFIGISLGMKIPFRLGSSKSNKVIKHSIRRNSLVRFYIVVTSLAAVLSFLVVILLYGIPILNPAARHGVSAYLTYFIALAWINLPLVYYYYPRKILFIFFSLFFLIYLAMGYRTPLLFMMLFVVLMNFGWLRIQITKRKLVLLSIFVVMVTGVFAFARFDDSARFEKIMNNLEVPSQFKYVAPIYFVFAEGYIVNSKILEINKNVGNQYGAFTASAFATILPGEQTHARNKLAYWMGRDNWRDSSTTPSLLGQFILEFGSLLTPFFCFLLGVYVKYFSSILLEARGITKVYPQVLFFSFLVLGIHTGILDPIILFMCFNYLFYLIFFTLSRLRNANS